jgi:anti-sigma factor RsiW
MERDEFEDLLAAYALDACDPAEEAAVVSHLEECPRCRAELARHLEVAGVLGNLGGEAPEGLWDRIWGEIAAPGQLEGASAQTLDDSRRSGSSAHPPPPFAVIEGLGGAGSNPEPPGETGGRPASSPYGARARKRFIYALAAGAVAAALAVAVGVLGTTVVNLNHQVSALNAAVVTGGVRGAEQATLADPNHKVVQLASATHEWKANLVVSPSLEAFIVPEKVPSIPASKTFQAWAVVHGKFVSLGVLGRSSRIHQLLLQPGMTAVLVNTEPLGGTSQPTTPLLLKGNLPTSL